MPTSPPDGPPSFVFVGALREDPLPAEGGMSLYLIQLERTEAGDYEGTAAARPIVDGLRAERIETEVRAELNGGRLLFEEIGIVYDGGAEPWCLRRGTLTLGVGLGVTGTWDSDGCGSGEIRLLDRGPEWFERLPDCPCSIEPGPDTWSDPGGTWREMDAGGSFWHPGATREVRWTPEGGGSGQQCTYDEDDELITGGLAAGTPDVVSPRDVVDDPDAGDLADWLDLGAHFGRDVVPMALVRCETYLTWRPPNNGNGCPTNEVTPVPSQGVAQVCLDALRAYARRAKATGDPHLQTFDGLQYDMQGVGEFVLARSIGDDVEVQIRTAPWRQRTDVAVTTAVAVSVGGDRVAAYLDGADIDLWVDGAPLDDGSTEVVLPGGGVLRRQADLVQIEGPGGARVAVRRYRDFLDVDVAVPLDPPGRYEGLLGNANDVVTDDLAAVDGEPFPLDLPFRSFYDDYVVQWRVTDTTSLFDYGPGESTATFTDLLFPWRPVSADDLPSADHDAAEAICLSWGLPAGSVALRDCILDVGVTGEPDFARSGARTLPAEASVDLTVAGDLPPRGLVERPLGGEQLRPGEVLVLEGRVADDQTPVADLTVEWISSIAGVLPITSQVDPSGVVTATGALDVGAHEIRLRVEDGLGQDFVSDPVTVTVARELPPCAVQPTLDIHPSCAAIPSTVNGVYAIDPDGPDQGEDPYCTYCLMSAQGGGWTLFASHEDGLAERMVTDPVEPGVPGVVSAARWAELRDGMTSGMLFVDENGVTSFLSTSTLAAANCTTPDDVTDLTGTSRLYLWHDENSGCTTTGTDYSIVGLTGSDYVLYESAGAALWQRSGLRFDTWGYGGLQHSYDVQDRLLYFIK